jgi:hypothetical protein
VLRPSAILAAWARARESGRLRRARRRAERVLAEFSGVAEASFEGTVLVDGMWDNPNYWIRYALLRRALGLAGAREIGITGRWRADETAGTFRALGIGSVVNLDSEARAVGDLGPEAAAYVKSLGSPDDLLTRPLPEGIPTDFLYDAVLKKQRTATVEVDDPRFTEHVEEFLRSARAAGELLTRTRPSLVVLSHVINSSHAPLAALALQRGIPVVLAFGNYGVCRFVRFRTVRELFDWTDRPHAEDFRALSPQRGALLQEAGARYLERRLQGETNDLGAAYAYRRRQAVIDRDGIRRAFGWRGNAPIVTVYASNWFDFPRACGMENFRDFLDWLQATVEVAKRTPSVNWLFKAHPCDEWYGGVTLSDLMPPLDAFPHIQQVPKDWNGAALMNSVDVLVTFHGTAGIEFAANGIPVLLADRGWYHDLEFATWPRSRDEYLALLASRWWDETDRREAARRAMIFAGWHFGMPSWQRDFVLQDDSVQWPIFGTVPALFAGSGSVIEREVRSTRDWFRSGHRFYHTWKMSHADGYVP